MQISDMADYAGMVMTRMGVVNGDADPWGEGWIHTPDNTGLYVSCYIDRDYEDFAMVEIRTNLSNRHPDYQPGEPTMVDHLFIHRFPDPKRHGRSRKILLRGIPHEIFEDVDHLEPFRDFIDWMGRRSA